MVIDGQIYLKSTFNQDFDQLDGPYVRRHELEVSARSAPIGPSGTNYLDTGKISNLGVKT